MCCFHIGAFFIVKLDQTITIPISFVHGFPQEQQYKFEHITIKQGLTSNNVYSIIKGPRGFMWFSTGIGLYRYDGYDFKVYRSDPNVSSTLSSNLITGHLFIDLSGNLWIGTKNNGLNFFNSKTEAAIQFKHKAGNPNSLSHNNVHKVFQDKAGTIWIATLGGGLNRFIHGNKAS